MKKNAVCPRNFREDLREDSILPPRDDDDVVRRVCGFVCFVAVRGGKSTKKLEHITSSSVSEVETFLPLLRGTVREGRRLEGKRKIHHWENLNFPPQIDL